MVQWLAELEVTKHLKISIKAFDPGIYQYNKTLSLHTTKYFYVSSANLIAFGVWIDFVSNLVVTGLSQLRHNAA